MQFMNCGTTPGKSQPELKFESVFSEEISMESREKSKPQEQKRVRRFIEAHKPGNGIPVRVWKCYKIICEG